MKQIPNILLLTLTSSNTPHFFWRKRLVLLLGSLFTLSIHDSLSYFFFILFYFKFTPLLSCSLLKVFYLYSSILTKNTNSYTKPFLYYRTSVKTKPTDPIRSSKVLSARTSYIHKLIGLYRAIQ